MWPLFDSLRKMKLGRVEYPVLMVGKFGVPRLSQSRLVCACWASQVQVLVAFSLEENICRLDKNEQGAS